MTSIVSKLLRNIQALLNYLYTDDPNYNLFLDTVRQKKSGKFPVKVRVIYLRVYHDYRTGLDLTEKEYEFGSVSNPTKHFKDIKAQLTAINKKIDLAMENIGSFTFQRFNDEFYGRVKDASDIFPFIEEYIATLNGDGQLKTAIGYNTALNSFKTYKARIGFYDISVKWLNGYHNWMQSNNKTETTIGIYVRKLRTIYNYAISIGVIKKGTDYPFGKRKYIIPAGKNIKKALTIAEVSLIYNYTAIELDAEDEARDFWMFSYMCNGINFKDIAQLKKKDIDGNMIRFVRAKTKKSNQANQTIISCAITDKIRFIIDKWKSSGNLDSYLFGILQEGDTLEIQQKRIDQFIKTTNKYVKRLCHKQGIEKDVTTYFSRHSAATIMKKAGVSVEFISEALGHASINTTRNYLDSFDDDVKMDIANKLTNF